ncbi:glutathione S-transferase family protein [Paraburkholderia dilworthii]|uniref:Glutathione S-transferase domain-containing protein n=1 Tax=Paraburkholderia dilworthii TaxID=948106 RepID=A0ABW9D8P8_9BURK
MVSAREGRPANEQKIAAALPRASVCLSEMSRLADDRGFLIGDQATLADMYAAPIFAYFMQAPEAASLMDGASHLCPSPASTSKFY